MNPMRVRRGKQNEKRGRMAAFFLSKIDDGLEFRQVPLDEVVLHLFPRDALGLDVLGDDGLFGVLETGPGAAAQLLGAQRGDVDVEKTALARRGLFEDDRRFFRGQWL